MKLLMSMGKSLTLRARLLFIAALRAVFACALLFGMTGLSNIQTVFALSAANSPASSVIGQPNFLDNTANYGDNSGSLNYPRSVYSDGQHLFVADRNNNRVLIYNGIPGVNGADTIADSVIGQPNMFSGTANNGGLSASSLSTPTSVYSDGQHVFVADFGNHRVLIYNGIPGVDGADNIADSVIGQPNMTSGTINSGGISASSLYYPYSVYSDGQHTFVTDQSNHRVLIYNGIPGVNGADNIADSVIGQPNMTSGTANNGGLSASSLYYPLSVYSDGQHLFVADYNREDFPAACCGWSC